MSPTYQPHEFAQRAGVTIRALHHYDRLGLLKPSGRTAAGYRLYTCLPTKLTGRPISKSPTAKKWKIS